MVASSSSVTQNKERITFRIHFPPNHPDMHLLTDNHVLLREFKSNTTRYKNSFFPDAVKGFTNIRYECSSLPYLDVFKKKTLCLIRPELKSVFNIHNTKGLYYMNWTREATVITLLTHLMNRVHITLT